MSVQDALGSGILNIAHRGARSLAPENTLRAARKALMLDAHMWELDVRMTADCELVVVHDDTLERTSNVSSVFPHRSARPVFTFTLEELKQLDFGSWFYATDPFGTILELDTAFEHPIEKFEPVLTLQEALEFTRNNQWLVNIEFKDLSGTGGDRTVVNKTISMIERMDMVADVILSSFKYEYLETARTKNPEIGRGVLVRHGVADPVGLLRQYSALSYHLGCMDPGSVEKVRRAGFEVLVWVVNESRDMRSLAQAGVSGVFTDYPQRFHTAVEATPNRLR